MKTILQEEKKKFPWYYSFKVSKEARDPFEIKKKPQNKENSSH